MSRRVKWGLLIGLPMLGLASMASYWGYQYSTHSTPEKAQAAIEATVRPFETAPFARGVVLFTRHRYPGSVTAWYVAKNLWGWHVSDVSQAQVNLSTQNYNVDMESLAADGKTFVWGTTMRPIKEIVYSHGGRTYFCRVGRHIVWHMVLPFVQQYSVNSDWTMVLPNGSVRPLFNAN